MGLCHLSLITYTKNQKLRILLGVMPQYPLWHPPIACSTPCLHAVTMVTLFCFCLPFQLIVLRPTAQATGFAWRVGAFASRATRAATAVCPTLLTSTCVSTVRVTGSMTIASVCVAAKKAGVAPPVG